MKSIYSAESAILSAWLREQRKARGMTMREAAKLLNKPHSFVGKIEVGQRRLDVVEYIWYCKVLKIDAIEGMQRLMKSL